MALRALILLSLVVCSLAQEAALPVYEVPAPAEPTEAPAAPTDPPTEAPAQPTEAPAQPTEAPAQPTEAPAEPTEAPAEPTAAPEAVSEAPVYEPASAEPAYQSSYQPAYQSSHHQPSYGGYQAHHQAPAEPACAADSGKPWCLEDAEYPEYEIQHAIQYHQYTFLRLYKDVVVNTSNSVDRLESIEEETYLCGSETAYVQPLRAVNTDGKWRVIVNNVQVHYDTFTQSARIEECIGAGESCPLVPHCYKSKCLQKSAYHRFLVYDPYDYYLPFATETFQLPASCACLLGAYQITH